MVSKSQGRKASAAEMMSSIVNGKSLSANDIETLEDARREISRIRKLMEAFEARNSFALPVGGGGSGGGGQQRPLKKQIRIAVNEGEAIQQYTKVAVPKSARTRGLIYEAIKTNVLFELNTEDELSEIVDVFEPVAFNAGDVVIQQGDKGDTFYVVEKGELSINVAVVVDADKSANEIVNIDVSASDTRLPEVKVGYYHEGASFGELALIYGSPRAATILATEDCRLWQISRKAFRGVVGTHRQRIHQQILAFLPTVNVGERCFGDLFDKEELENMALSVKYASYKRGDVIIREGEEGDTFYMIAEGHVDISKRGLGGGKPIACLGKQKFFGERALLSTDVRGATCTAASDDVRCYVLTRGDFNRMLGSLQDVLDGKPAKRTLVGGAARDTIETASTPQLKYQLSDLKMLNVLGEGAFGKVRLVKHNDTQKYYALKSQKKHFVVKNGQKAYLLNEYRLMQELSGHPNIIKFYGALQDDRYIYFLLELLPGGELMDHLQDRGRLPEHWTKFYSAAVLLAYFELHSRRIVYRDLKPENLVLDANGYCVMIDFGLAKKCDGPTYTFCGTPDYLSPETIRGTGYDWGADYWALGILLYELTNGSAPFASMDPTKTAKKILKGVVRFPPKFSDALQDLIRGLLVLDQSRRLGRTQGGGEEITKHRFYGGVDWEGILDKKAPVPFKPKAPKNIETLGRKENSKKDNTEKSNWFPDL